MAASGFEQVLHFNLELAVQPRGHGLPATAETSWNSTTVILAGLA
jgi:hypothetical protein